MHKNSNSTIWLDFYSYIFVPFYIFVLSLETIKNFSKNSIFINILLITIMIYSIFVLYSLIKKNKKYFYFIFPFILISIVSIIIYFINKFNINNTYYRIELVVICSLLWTVPNVIYLLKRKVIFREHSLAHIKKCPGCNRIIPIDMKSCGKCNYKED